LRERMGASGSNQHLKSLDITSPLTTQQVVQIWNRFDTNRSGYLEKEQADAFVTEWCKAQDIIDPVQVAKVRTLFWEHYDVVGDGRIAQWEIMNEKAAGVDEAKFNCVFCNKAIPLSWLRLPCAAREEAIRNLELDLVANKELAEAMVDAQTLRQVQSERKKLEGSKALWKKWDQGHMPSPENWQLAREMLDVFAAVVSSLQKRIRVLEEQIAGLELENASLTQRVRQKSLKRDSAEGTPLMIELGDRKRQSVNSSVGSDDD